MRLYLDTNIFIYAMESENDEGRRARTCLDQIEQREIEGVTSELTLAEVLRGGAAPLDPGLAAAYAELLSPGSELEVVAVGRDVLIDSARIGTCRKIGLADAIHVATALRQACDGFLTEDRRLPMPPGLTKMSLADRVPAP